MVNNIIKNDFKNSCARPNAIYAFLLMLPFICSSIWALHRKLRSFLVKGLHFDLFHSQWIHVTRNTADGASRIFFSKQFSNLISNLDAGEIKLFVQHSLFTAQIVLINFLMRTYIMKNDSWKKYLFFLFWRGTKIINYFQSEKSSWNRMGINKNCFVKSRSTFQMNWKPT